MLTRQFTESPTQFDGWVIWRTRLLDAGEEFDLPTRTAWVDPSAVGPERAVAHVIAHLSLRHHLRGCSFFTEEMCAEADDEAAELLLTGHWSFATADAA